MVENAKTKKKASGSFWNKSINLFKNPKWNKPVPPLIAYPVLIGTLAVALILGVLIIG